MEFLQNRADSGYPTDYLISRVRGRRAYLLRDWENILLSPDISIYLASSPYREFLAEYSTEGIWKRYMKELQWIYCQMNKNLRDMFQPYFMYSELDTLLMCLRYQSAKGKKAVIEDILAFSLLSDKIRSALAGDTDLPFILDLLEAQLLFITERSPGLNDIFATEGLPGVEQRITETLLENIVNYRMPPFMKRFFIPVIDSINIITLYKHLRWEITSKPVFIKGGGIKEPVLRSILQSHEISELMDLIHRQTGLFVDEPAASNIDSTLRKWITGELKKMERTSPDMGLILHYLWRFSMEARNLMIVSHGSRIDKTVLRGELVHDI